MPISKDSREIHTYLAELHEKFGDRKFISFRRIPEIRGSRFLEPLVRAVEQKKVVRIFYLPYYEDKPYFIEVHPYLIREHGFRWYLVGLNDFKKEVRTYALDRIRDLQEDTTLPYTPPPFDTSEYFRHSIGIIAPEGSPPLIRLSVQKTQAQYLISQPWHETQNIESENEEQVVFSFRVHPTYEFRSLVLGLGRDATVLEPASLRREVITELERMLLLYQSG